MIFVLFYSLIYSLYHHTKNSISTNGYLFMCGITNPFPIVNNNATKKKLEDSETVDEISTRHYLKTFGKLLSTVWRLRVSKL